MNPPEIVTTPSGDKQKQAELHRMKILATSLLIGTFVVFVIASIFENRYIWVSFVRATTEAAMVGAIADWFAVTALFRYPLGLKIPHTAIIPRRKDSIAQQFGHFVKNNFLSTEVIADRLRSMDLARQMARWLSRPENSEAIADYVMIGVGAVAQVIKDEDVQELIEQSVSDHIRAIQVAPFVGKALSLVVADSRQQELLKGFIILGARLLEENKESIKRKINQEIPWWLPRSVDSAIYQKILDAYGHTLQEVTNDPNHPLYDKFDALIEQFVDDLKHSPAVLAKEEAWKEELLHHDAIRNFSSSLWADTKRLLLDQSAQEDTDLRRPIRHGLIRFGHALLAEEPIREKVNGWIEDGALYLVREYGHEVEQLITQTIQKWDAEATSQKIEIQIGRDLQFIRINGTVVGGLVGLLIHTFSFFFLRS